jgi:hypothetical protein
MFFTVIAVMAGLCLAAGEPPRAAGSLAGGTEGVTGRIDSFVPPSAEEPALFVKAGDTRFIPLRTEFQRISIPCGMSGAAPAFYRFLFGASRDTGMETKNIILLKLRI